ncbi:uncharacterized protein [Montipora foliosa]|uniref:uncharacterized protein n=1 Tax=Montipora foliosa TaxID=591990 RepID=UPI0035F1088C
MAGNMPCSTLFVANLEKECTEQLLRDAFGETPGFRRLKMLSQRTKSSLLCGILGCSICSLCKTVSSWKDHWNRGERRYQNRICQNQNVRVKLSFATGFFRSSYN